MKSLSSLVLALLVGCSTVPETKFITVKGPVPPVIEMPQKPDVPKDAGFDAKVRSIAEYVLELQARLQQAIEALEVYR